MNRVDCREGRTAGCGSVVQLKPSKLKAGNSIPSTTEKDAVGPAHSQAEWWPSGTGEGDRSHLMDIVLVLQDENTLEMQVVIAA